MAWYALYRWFAGFRKKPYINYIGWYKQYMYDNWFDSLSDEDKATEQERISKLKADDEYKSRTAVAMLCEVMNIMADKRLYF
jgi:hypothetical protein